MAQDSDAALESNEIDSWTSEWRGGKHVVTVTKGKQAAEGIELSEADAFAAALKNLKKGSTTSIKDKDA